MCDGCLDFCFLWHGKSKNFIREWTAMDTHALPTPFESIVFVNFPKYKHAFIAVYITTFLLLRTASQTFYAAADWFEHHTYDVICYIIYIYVYSVHFHFIDRTKPYIRNRIVDWMKIFDAAYPNFVLKTAVDRLGARFTLFAPETW